MSNDQYVRTQELQRCFTIAAISLLEAVMLIDLLPPILRTEILNSCKRCFNITELVFIELTEALCHVSEQ